MKTETIIFQVNRLIRNFNPESGARIIESKIDLIRDELAENYTDRQFIEAVDEILHDENVKRFPTIAQIRNYMRKGKAHSHEEAQRFCDTCEGTGYYSIWQYKESLGQYYSFPFRCLCNNTFMQHVPLIDPRAIPKRAHADYPSREIETEY